MTINNFTKTAQPAAATMDFSYMDPYNNMLRQRFALYRRALAGDTNAARELESNLLKSDVAAAHLENIGQSFGNPNVPVWMPKGSTGGGYNMMPGYGGFGMFPAMGGMPSAGGSPLISLTTRSSGSFQDQHLREIMAQQEAMRRQMQLLSSMGVDPQALAHMDTRLKQIAGKIGTSGSKSLIVNLKTGKVRIGDINEALAPEERRYATRGSLWNAFKLWLGRGLGIAPHPDTYDTGALAEAENIATHMRQHEPELKRYQNLFKQLTDRTFERFGQLGEMSTQAYRAMQQRRFGDINLPKQEQLLKDLNPFEPMNTGSVTMPNPNAQQGKKFENPYLNTPASGQNQPQQVSKTSEANMENKSFLDKWLERNLNGVTKQEFATLIKQAKKQSGPVTSFFENLLYKWPWDTWAGRTVRNTVLGGLLGSAAAAFVPSVNRYIDPIGGFLTGAAGGLGYSIPNTMFGKAIGASALPALTASAYTNLVRPAMLSIPVAYARNERMVDHLSRQPTPHEYFA